MILELVELVKTGFAIETEGHWYKYRTQSGELVVFWGERNEPNFNLHKLQSQPLPFLVELHDPEEYQASEYMKKEYNVRWSVSADCDMDVMDI